MSSARRCTSRLPHRASRHGANGRCARPRLRRASARMPGSVCLPPGIAAADLRARRLLEPAGQVLVQLCGVAVPASRLLGGDHGVSAGAASGWPKSCAACAGACTGWPAGRTQLGGAAPSTSGPLGRRAPGGQRSAGEPTTRWTPICGGRVAGCATLSGIFDLRPLVRTTIAGRIGLDEASASALSPLLKAAPAGWLLAGVGGAETSGFIDQTRHYVGTAAPRGRGIDGRLAGREPLHRVAGPRPGRRPVRAGDSCARQPRLEWDVVTSDGARLPKTASAVRQLQPVALIPCRRAGDELHRRPQASCTSASPH